MKPADAEEYTQALGQVVAGGWRQIALAQRLGVPQALKLTARQWVKQRLGGYVKYSVNERDQAIRALHSEGFKWEEIQGAIGTGTDQISKALGTPAGSKQKQKSDAKKTAIAPAGSEPMDVMTGLAADDALREQVESQTTRQQRQSKREAVAAEKQRQATLPDAKFRVVYADPPWSYTDKADAGSVQSGGAEQHYPSMSISELCELSVAAICEPNAVLFMWTTSPMLFEAFSVIEAWGFAYKASFVWDKHAHNMGHYNSVRHEYLLVCVRGSCPPDVPKLFDSVQKTGRTEHSEKPNVFRIIIDTLYPYGKRVELFAREQVDGWVAWGNEIREPAGARA